ncbi:SDR family oxidoreductase [Acinetobacter sp. HY1485]|uniref:SDR family oxidoreductase n=1 Tax=Acinetobacter sp. HY1485 TaxID=2970918 RepID=UPI0022B98A10|nr:SDR family oxidoreductase [Acinetobacter sp. HY1485]
MDNKVAIITGASRGIGAAIAKRLAADGFKVVVNYSQTAKSALRVVEEIEQAGGQAIALQADIAQPHQVKALFEQTIQVYGGVDVLVNNAGIMQLAPIADTTDDMFDQQINVNLKGTFNTLREAAQYLREGGRIINFSTSVVGLKLENYAVYAATKAAVETMTAIFAKELRGKNICVNAIAPGPTATDLFLNEKSPELIERMAQASPLQRLAQPDDIAATVAFLASKDGAWINGQTLRANGGLV